MKGFISFLPIFQWLPSYKKQDLKGDVFAGITVGIMLVPQGMAYALIAGLPAVYGLYASIVPQIMYAILGTSRQLSVAPVAMDSLLVATGISVLAAEGTNTYISFAILLAFFTGSFQLLLGIFRLGFITNLLSKPVISGFTSAVALIIGLNQLGHLLGIEISKSNQSSKVLIYVFNQLDQIHLVSLMLGVGGVLLIFLFKRINKGIPGTLVAVIFGITLVYFFSLDKQGVSIVEMIPEGLPALVLPDLSFSNFWKLMPLAFTLSIVAFIESFSVAKSIETRKNDHQVIPNQELIGLGVANIVGSLFQSFPVAGGFSRTAVNYHSGSNTPLSCIISAVLVALILIFLTPLFYYLPYSILASIIIVAAANLFNWRYMKKLWLDSKKEFLVLFMTFLITINIGIVTGVITGIILSILLFLYGVAYPHIAHLGRIKGYGEFRNITRFHNLETWEGLVILRIDASLSFINIQKIKDYIRKLISANDMIKVIIIDASPIHYMDVTAVENLHHVINELNKKKVRLVLCDIIGPVRDTMQQAGLTDMIGEKNLFLNLNDALENVLNSTKNPLKSITLQSNNV